MVDYNTVENLDIKRKEMQEDSKFADFPKNLQNVTDNRQYRKRGTKLYSDVVKSVDSSTEQAKENSNTIVDLKNVQSIFMRDENLKSSKIENSPPDFCTDSSSSGNAYWNVSLNVKSKKKFSAQDEELLEILEELQKPTKGTIGENDRPEGYFCSDAVFNLSNRILSNSENKILEKGLAGFCDYSAKD